MNRLREFAKFASGFEAFHAVLHGSLWLSESEVKLFGLTPGREMNMVGLLVGALVSLGLAIFAWQPHKRLPF